MSPQNGCETHFRVDLMSQCYCDYLTIYNTLTGESFKPFCRSYSCPVHGNRNINILKSKINYEIESWDSVRMWTFTLSSKVADSVEKHYEILNKLWRYLITYLRRKSALSNKQKNFKYIRIAEKHQSGYYHFHVLVDQFLDFQYVYGIWNQLCKLFLETNKSIGGCHVKFIPSVRKAGYYVVKYVTKEVQSKSRTGKIYTKSVGITFFPRRKNYETYCCYDSKREKWFGLYPIFSLLVHHSNSLHSITTQYDLFQFPNPP